MLIIENLKYQYNNGSNDKISFEFSCESFFAKRGEIVCFTGKDQCGKTTLSMLLAGIKAPLDGKIEFENINFKSISKLFKRSVGFLSSSNIFYPEISFLEYLRFISTAYGISNKDLMIKINWFSEFIDISSIIHQKARTSSNSDKQKIKIFTSILHNPKLLILDEPYFHLDLNYIDKLNELLKYLSTNHLVTILVFKKNRDQNNDIEEIKNIISKFIILKNGKIIKEYFTSEIQKSANDRDILFKDMIWSYV